MFRLVDRDVTGRGLLPEHLGRPVGPVELTCRMIRPTSDRERRLWLWALAVVVAVYSTIGLAGTLVSVLGESGLLEPAFALGFLLVIAAIVGSALKRRPVGRERWVWLGLVAVYGMVIVRMGVSLAERTHLFEYGLLAVLVHQALLERRRNGTRVPVPALFAVLTTSLVGVLDEGIQGLIPNRVFDLRDVGINALAGVMAVAASVAIAWARRRAGPRRRGMAR